MTTPHPHHDPAGHDGAREAATLAAGWACLLQRRPEGGTAMTGQTYAGDIDSRQALALLREDPRAVLVDVRTEAEWLFVGHPDPSALEGRVLFISWQTWPGMAHNPHFLARLRDSGVDADAPLLLLCRSGARSRDAAQALTEAGFRRCFNIADGFEGPPDARSQRNRLTGWRANGLPWRQS